MAPYNTAPSGIKAVLASPGSATFLLGSRAPTGGEMYVTSVAIATNVATVGVSSWDGNLPIVGTPITIRGTSQSSGLFNVTNAVVTAVTLDATGTGTVTFALTGANLATTADGGILSFPPQITGETVAVGSTLPLSPAFNQGRSQNSYFFEIVSDSVSALPTAATFTPQQANVNQDSAFVDIASVPVGTIAAGAITAAGGSFLTDALFVRLRTSAVTGTGKVAAVFTY